MNVLIVEPEKAPREAEIGSGLKAMQDIVGGYIEATYPYDDPIALVCNEEGKLTGLPLNRKIEDYDIIAGTFFICGLSEDNFDSLPPDLMAKYKDKFAQPEQFKAGQKYHSRSDGTCKRTSAFQSEKRARPQRTMKGARHMKRPLAYITAPWGADDIENTEKAARYCRKVYDAGFTPICPILFLPLFLNDPIPQEHKDGIDMARDFLRRAHVLVVCVRTVDESMKNDIAVAERLRITATTLDGILTVKGQGREINKGKERK